MVQRFVPVLRGIDRNAKVVLQLLLPDELVEREGGLSRPERAQPEPVGTFPADESPYGVRDMMGTIREWTRSWYDERAGTRNRREELDGARERHEQQRHREDEEPLCERVLPRR